MDTSISKVAVGALLLVCVQAGATPCVSISYDELQDMSVDELSQELCVAKRNANQNRIDSFDKRMSRYAADPAGADILSAEGDRCDNEIKRILRVIGKKIDDPKALEKATSQTVCNAKKT